MSSSNENRARHLSPTLLVVILIVLILILTTMSVIMGGLFVRFINTDKIKFSGTNMSGDMGSLIIRQSEILENDVAGSDVVNCITPSTVIVNSGESRHLGIIVSSGGHILTSSEGLGNEITVTTCEGDEYSAQLVRTDKKNGLAVIKISASNLVCAVFADSDMLLQGTRIYKLCLIDDEVSIFEGIISSLHLDDKIPSVASDIVSDGCRFLILVNSNGDVIAAGTANPDGTYSSAFASNYVRSMVEG